MLGDGHRKFRLGSRLRDFNGFGLTATGDFNGDGNLDLVTKGYRFTIFLGNGDGTFQHFKNYPYRLLTEQILVGDFNNDGKLDLILMQEPMVNNNNHGIAFYFLQGNGDGTFRRPQRIASFPSVNSCAGGGSGNSTAQLSDFNGDGTLDLAFCNDLGQVGILLGNGDGTFQPEVFYTANTNGGFAYVIGDINSDGTADLLISQFPAIDTQSFAVLLGKGNGSFEAAQVLLTGGPFADTGMLAGDFNADGLLDFVYLNGLGMELFLQTE